jgi:hypothetical protein
MGNKNKPSGRIPAKENYLTAYIMKGNRQCLIRYVKASRRFREGQDTYIIKPSCTFTEVVEGKLKANSYYSEGNPNPYDFKGVNEGIDYDEFDRLYGEDLYDMLVKLQSDKKTFYLICLYIFVLVFSLITLISVFFIHVP